MKNVLIPTDFSIRSLSLVKAAVQAGIQEPMHITLVHFFKMSDSIQDLMMLSKRTKDYDQVSDAFKAACKELQERYPKQILSIKINCFYGSTIAVFKNFLFANGISLIAYDENYRFNKINKSSIDPLNIIKKSGCALLNLAPAPEREEHVRVIIKSIQYN